MKRLVCEMCGSTDLIKDGGVFVCQTCGCKYSVEEAKKMMIEGTVEVQGTVKVDRSAEISNILKNADTTYEDGNYKEAFYLYSQVISSEPDNEHAILFRAMSSAWQSSVKECKIGEINKSAERAIRIKHEKCGDTREFFDFARQALSDIAPIINAIDNMYINYHNKAMPTNLSVTGAIATAGIAEEVKTTMKNGVKSCCTVAHNLVNSIIFIAEDYAEANTNFWNMMEVYPKNCRIYRKNAQMNPNPADQQLLDKIAGLRRKGEADAKLRRTEKMNQYWEEHQEEKNQLENQITELQNSITEIENLIASIPEKAQIEDLHRQIVTLASEKRNIVYLKIKHIIRNSVSENEKKRRRAV